jgi:murein DD-endopeptidase MepM/ murein hydrolase activator NlpD
MGKKAFSLIIIPHSKVGSRSLSISKKTVKVALGAAAFLFVVFCALLVDYFSMGQVRAKYQKLIKESADQKTILLKYRANMDRLQQTVESFEVYVKKLNIMAGLKAPGVSEVGIGDGTSGPSVQPLAALPQNLTLTNMGQISQKAEVLEKNLSTLVNFFENQSARLACTPTIWPTLGWVTSGFGPRTDPFTAKPAFHYGLDIATNMGNPIYATADGTVIQVKTDKMSGKSILINHGNNVATGYLHLDAFLVREGQKIRRGDVIGLVGRTGKALGPHLHYEIRINGIHQNPYLYILEE